MIAVTSNAARAVGRMTNTETYPDAGLRIKKVADHEFALSIVPDPTGTDVAVPGTNIYLDQPAAAALEHATLDAKADATLAGQLILDKTNSRRLRALIGGIATIGDWRPYNTALAVRKAEAAAYAIRRGLADGSAAALATDTDVVRRIEAGVAEGDTRLSRAEQIKRSRILSSFWERGGEQP